MQYGIDLISHLQGAGYKVRSSGSLKWRAQCPGHDGRGLNLAITQGRDKWKLHCFSRGCDGHQIMQALGLHIRDLYHEPKQRDTYTPGPRIHTFTSKEEAEKAVQVISSQAEARSIQELVEETLGENPCRRTKFTNEATGEVIAKLCDSPRCDDCGPRKSSLMWHRAESLLGAQVNLVHITDAGHYQKVIDAIRYHRRSGVDYQYLSWAEGDDRWLITDAPLVKHKLQRVQLASLKKRITTMYQMGWAKLRKSWKITLTLSPRRKGKSVSLWRYVKGILARSLSDAENQAKSDAQKDAHMQRWGHDPGEWATWQAQNEYGDDVILSAAQPFSD